MYLLIRLDLVKPNGDKIGLAYSPLPKLIQAHARHILINFTPHRRGIELMPHQLIASKTVGVLLLCR